VVAEPDSEITEIYLEVAAAVRAALDGLGDGAVRHFPDISISDD
jgi:ATP-binding protein involved in chromosome partitioning